MQNTKSTHKNQQHLFANRELSEKGIKKAIPFAITKKYKIPRNKRNQRVKYLHEENYKTWMKGIEEDTNKEKKFYAQALKKCSIVKMSLLFKMIYRFKAIRIKIPFIFRIIYLAVQLRHKRRVAETGFSSVHRARMEEKLRETFHDFYLIDGDHHPSKHFFV